MPSIYVLIQSARIDLSLNCGVPTVKKAIHKTGDSKDFSTNHSTKYIWKIKHLGKKWRRMKLTLDSQIETE